MKIPSKPPPLTAYVRRLVRELDALRMATVLIAAVMRSEVFTPRYAPIADDLETRLDWLRAALLPLGPSSSALRKALRLLKHESISPLWDDPKWARRELKRIKSDIQKLALTPTHTRNLHP